MRPVHGSNRSEGARARSVGRFLFAFLALLAALTTGLESLAQEFPVAVPSAGDEVGPLDDFDAADAWDDEQDPPLDWLIPYYEAVSKSTIRPTFDSPDGIPLQDFFQLDVAGFNADMGVDNFVAAKRAFYGDLAFSDKEQKHREPYYYLKSWRLLFHPPIKRLELPLRQYVPELKPHDPAAEESRFFDPSFHWNIDYMTGTELTYGNQLELRPNSSSYRERLRMLRESKRYFFGMVMFYMCDGSGEEFLGELIRKAKSGVDVRMVVEGLYASTINKKCIDRMEDGGVDVIRVADFWKPKYIASVLHNKFWIRDGEEAVMGGQNFHDFANHSDGFSMTRDTDVWIKSGPAVTDLMSEYLRLWDRYRKKKKNKSVEPYAKEIKERIQAERDSRVRGRVNYTHWLGNKEKRMNGICRVLVQDRDAERNAIAPVLIEHFNAARNHVFFTTPGVKYELKRKKKKHMEDHLAEAVKQAAGRGVQVDVISNGLAGGMGDLTNFFEKALESDTLEKRKLIRRLLRSLGASLSRSGARKDREHLTDLERVGVRGWGYMQFLHAKTQVFDRIVSGVGSWNWDRNSSEKNHEAEMLCLDRRLKDQLERQMVLDVVNSVPMVQKD